MKECHAMAVAGCRPAQITDRGEVRGTSTVTPGKENATHVWLRHGERMHRCQHQPAAKVWNFTKENQSNLQKYTARNQEYTNVITIQNAPNYKIQHLKTPSIRILHLPNPLQKVSKSPFIFVTEYGICPSQREILQYQQITHFLFI